MALSLTVNDPKLWNVGQGNLCDVTLELRAGGQVLDQGYWPESTITPPSDEAMQFDIRALRETNALLR